MAKIIISNIVVRLLGHNHHLETTIWPTAAAVVIVISGPTHLVTDNRAPQIVALIWTFMVLWSDSSPTMNVYLSTMV